MLLNCLQRRARIPMRQMNEGWNARVAKVLQSYRFITESLREADRLGEHS